MRPLKHLGSAAIMLTVLALTACGGVAVKSPSNNAQPLAETTKPASVPTGVTTVALLAPLSGDIAPVGQQLVNAAAVAVFERPDVQVELVPFDTQGTPEGAAQAAAEARAANVDLVLGPLFGAHVPIVRQGMLGTNVPVLAFTNDPAQAGGSDFAMGLSVGAQVERMVSFLAGQQKTRLILIGPDNEYTSRTIAAAEAAMLATGGTLVGSAVYPEDADFNQIATQVQEITDYQARRGTWQSYATGLKTRVRGAANPAAALRQEAAQFSGNVREVMLQGMAKVYDTWAASGRNRALAEVMQRIDGVDAMPVSDYDAVILPVGDDNLVAIGSLLDLYNGGRGFAQLSGTNLWSNVDLSSEPSLIGGWFTQMSETPLSPFVLAYRNNFQETPEGIAVLGYHGVRVAMEAMLSGVRPVTPEFVQRPQGFDGLVGTVRFGSDKLMRHPLSIYQVNPEGPQELQGAEQPSS